MKGSNLFLALVFIFFQTICYSQKTVGVITLEDGSFDGYTFFSPFAGTKAYLVDNCGRLVNVWDRGTRPGLAAYLLEDGNMLRTYKANIIGPFTSASNSGGIEIVDWYNDTIWQYEINTDTQLSHHDAIQMPNGNILVLTWELTFMDELIELGRDPNEIAPQQFMWSEKILELKPIGNADAEIVWQWHINDHYIQDFDPSKSNYGIVSEHPELFNINYPDLNSGNSNSSRDWNHFNSIDYNEDLDQIAISVRNSDEVWVLDHSTTIEEAAGHEGGNSGKGGDILFRWGNASSYELAPVGDQKLFGQHGVHWVKKGLPNEGKILIFNNGNGNPGGSYSRIQIIDPLIIDGQYTRDSNLPFGPKEANTLYGEALQERFYSAYMSNAQQLPNGNMLINAGSPGRIFEINSENEIVWDYIIPLFGDVPATQGQTIASNANFRAYKFNADYPGLADKDLTPGSQIEINPEPCELPLSTASTTNETPELFFDHSSRMLRLNGCGSGELEIFDQMGKKVFTSTIKNEKEISLYTLHTGIFFVKFKKANLILSKSIYISNY